MHHNFFISFYLMLVCIIIQHGDCTVMPVADPGFGQGGSPRSGPPDLADVAERSRRAKRAYLGMGSGAHLRAPETFGVFVAKYAFS